MGVRYGQWQWFYEDGKKWIEINLTKGKEDGHWIAWYNNGNVREEVDYKHGRKNGQWFEYYESGEKLCEGFYIMGKEDSTWQGWHRNGIKKYLKTYKNGSLITSTEWDEDGKIILK